MEGGVVKQLFEKRKAALLLSLGTSVGLAVGGSLAWWLTQQRPVAGLPGGSDVIPQEAVTAIAFSTDEGQWQQLKRFGNSDMQSSVTNRLAQWRDRLMTDNGLNYQRDIKPWVGPEITVAFLLPPAPKADANNNSIQPYTSPGQGTTAESSIVVMPIVNPEKANQWWAQPAVAKNQDWVDREYKGLRIREVQGQTERAYAIVKLDDRFVIVGDDSQSLERVIDTYRGGAALTKTPGYGSAFGQLASDNEKPLLRFYVNVPAARTLTQSNPLQPLPPLSLVPLRNNQGTVGNLTVESDGLQLRGVSWLAANSKYRYRVTNNAKQIPDLLPADALLVTSGGNFQQFWQDYSQPISDDSASANAIPGSNLLSPNSLEQGLTRLTGLNLQSDVLPWTNGEYAMALISEPGTADSPNPKTGAVLLLQSTDRKAADQAFQKFDSTLKDRYRFKVTAGKIAEQSVVTLVSPFSALTITRGWLNNNIAFVALGNGVANTILPSPGKALAADTTFREATASSLDANNGHFFLKVDRLVAPVTNLPLPILPAENRAFLSSIRAIGLTTAIQDSRTTRYDLHLLLRRPGEAPAPSAESPSSSAAPSLAPSPGQ